MEKSYRKLYNKFIFSVLIGVAFMLPFICNGSKVSCAEVNPSITIGLANSSTLSRAVEQANNYSFSYGKFKFITWKTSAKNIVVSVNMVKYRKLEADEKKVVMQSALDGIQSSRMASQYKLKVYNFVAEQDESVSSLVRQLSTDVNADFATAYSWFRPFSGGVSTILGLLSIILFVTLGLMVLIDLGYLAIPPFRSLLEGTGSSKPKFISNEAYSAVIEVEKGTSKKDVLGVYFKKKFKQIFIISICLLYLVGGKIYDLVAWVIDSFSGVIG